jgi:hypothetical protein
MKKLQTKSEPIPLLTPPQTDFERRIAENLGFVQSPSGQWVRFEPDPRPSVEVIRKWPYPRRCRACRDQFRSRRRVAYCGSCRRILDNALRRLESILCNALNKNEEQQREARAKIEEDLACPQCGWTENAGRVVPIDLELTLKYLRGWVERAHLHFFRHVFWNRFPYNRRFAPPISADDMRSTYGSSPADQVQIFGFEIEHVGSVEFKPLGMVEIPLLQRAPSPANPEHSATSDTPTDME